MMSDGEPEGAAQAERNTSAVFADVTEDRETCRNL